MTLAGFATIGFCVNLWLYLDDIKNRNSVLNEIKKKNEGLTTMMTSPPPTRRSLVPNKGEDGEEIPTGVAVDIYAENKSTRDALKRSMARRAGEFSQ